MNKQTSLTILAAVLAGAGLAFDLSVPLGVAGGVVYVAVIMVAARSRWPRLILIMAGVCTALTLLGWYGSPGGGIAWQVTTNRVLSIFVIWVVALLSYQRSKVEQVLRASEHRFRVITDGMPALIAYVTGDRKYGFVNRRYSEWVGLPCDEIIGKDPLEVLPLAVRPIAEANIRAALGGRSLSSEMEFPISEGDKRWLHTEIVPDRDGNGRVNGFFLLARDITAQKRAEEMLRRSEERFRELTETTRVIPWEADARSWLMTFVGPQSKPVLGYEIEEWRTTTFWQDHIHPEDRQWAIAYCRDQAAVRDDFEFDYRMMAADGRVVWLHDVVHVVRDGDGPRLLRGFMIDITARKAAEEKLRLVSSAVEHSYDGIVITTGELDPPGPQIVYVNPAFTQITGYGSREVIGKTPRILHGPKTDRAVLDRLRAQLSKGMAFAGEVINYRKDGSEFLMEWRVDPIRDEKGRVTHWVSINRDITLRKKLAEQNRHHLEELAHMSRLTSMGELATGLAHELNQPLTAISTYNQTSLRLIRAGKGDSQELMGVMTDATAECRRASQIIQRLRNLVRKRKPHRIQIDINHVLREVIELLAHEAHRRQIELKAELADGLPLILADNVQIEQVVLNLVRNAIEAAGRPDQGGGEVKVVSRSAEGGGVEVCVHNNGSSLDDEQMKEIFKPFYTTKKDGLGMGLPISLSIIEAHRGRLSCHNNPEGGATFKFKLPAS